MNNLFDKKPLNTAFSAMRKAGIFARQSFECCQSCGLASVPEEQAEKRGYVFYHQQDAEDLKKKGECYLAWGIGGGMGAQKNFGNKVREILESAGVVVDWNGSNDTRIKIKLAEIA